jgi:N-acetylmuramoyl-L-alanine amidase
MRERPSPNHDARPPDQAVDILLLHYTGMPSAAAALDRLVDPAARVSAHYLIEEDGAVWRLVDEGRRAWHAGVSHWAGATDINARSIGIELVNPGHEFGYRPFPAAQMAALEALAARIVARHPIPRHRVLGHADVAPRRKEDPGELFDWPRLARAGLAIWPQPPVEPRIWSVGEAQTALARFGYGVPRGGHLDIETRAVATAFQRHFRPQSLTGELDAECCGILAALLAEIG